MRKRIIAIVLCGILGIQPVTIVHAESLLEETNHEINKTSETIEDSETVEASEVIEVPEAVETPEESETPEIDPVVSFSIDKTIMSEGETATITVEMAEGYNAKYFSVSRPITDNTDLVSLYETSEGIYTGTFEVTDQTESGVWKVSYLAYTEKVADNLSNYRYIYNSNNYTGSSRETMDFSSIDFEVVGTNADVTAPKLKNYTIDKTVVSQGEKITITINIEDEHLPTSLTSISLQYRMPLGDYESIFFKKIDDTGLYEATYNITDQTEKGIWKPNAFYLKDANENSVRVNNSAVTSSGTVKEDLSSLNFEVVDTNDNGTVEQEFFIVIFKDGYGNTLSTQKVAKGEAAIEPKSPTNELYLFDGWDSDFTNITSNKTINAKWKLNPDVVYDKEAHVGGSFEIKVYSTVSQDYTITCNEDINFTSVLSGSGMIFSDQLYYYKEYEIQVNDAGSYLFSVKGSRSSNTLVYKVKITPHDWEKEFTIDKDATCTEEGNKSYHCSRCDAKTEVTVIQALGHDFSQEWTVDKEVTCTEEGNKSHHCSRCDEKSDVTIIPATGHKYDEGKVTTEPTCTKKGEKTFTCSVCNALRGESIPALDHDFSEEWTVDKEATCTKEGSKSRHCSRCEDKVDVIVIPILEHSPETAINKATLTANGELVEKCSRCEEIFSSETIYYPKSISLSATKLTYSGDTQTPTVKVVGSDGKVIDKDNYSVRYSSSTRKAMGRYSVEVTFKGNYSGRQLLYFTIGPKNPSSVSVSLYGYDDAQVKWSKVSGATGYAVYYRKSTWSSYVRLGSTTGTSYKKSNLADGAKYYFKVYAYRKVDGNNCYSVGGKTSSGIYALKRISTPKVSRYGTRVKVSWTNIVGESGYQISRSTSRTGTYIASTYKTTSGKYKYVSATKGKYYYYKVRAYRQVGTKKIYGPWSTAVRYRR